MDELADAGWASRAGGGRWALACDPGQVAISDVYRRFVLAPESRVGGSRAETLRSLLSSIGRNIDQAMAAPIKTLAGSARIESPSSTPAHETHSGP